MGTPLKMSLIWTCVYYVMWTEIVLVLTLSLPLPESIRRPAIKTIAGSSILAQLRTGIIFVGVALILLFADAYRTSARLRSKKAAIDLDDMSMGANTMFSRDDADRFRAERNMYICGLTIILALVLYVMQGLIVQVGESQIKHDILKKQAENSAKHQSMMDESSDAELKKLKASVKALKARLGESGAKDDNDGEGDVPDELVDANTKLIEDLRAENLELVKAAKSAKLNAEAIKSQAESQGIEVDRLMDENARLQRQVGNMQASESKKDK